jgi:hypothetical protein
VRDSSFGRDERSPVGRAMARSPHLRRGSMEAALLLLLLEELQRSEGDGWWRSEKRVLALIVYATLELARHVSAYFSVCK